MNNNDTITLNLNLTGKQMATLFSACVAGQWACAEGKHDMAPLSFVDFAGMMTVLATALNEATKEQ